MSVGKTNSVGYTEIIIIIIVIVLGEPIKQLKFAKNTTVHIPSTAGHRIDICMGHQVPAAENVALSS